MGYRHSAGQPIAGVDLGDEQIVDVIAFPDVVAGCAVPASGR